MVFQNMVEHKLLETVFKALLFPAWPLAEEKH